MNGVFTKQFVLKSLAEKYNEYSKMAAYWYRMEHPEWGKYGTAAIALLEVVTTLFEDGKDYKLTFVSETLNGVEFEWRKMEVV